MVQYACSKKQIKHIQVISNGTIMPSEELLNAMKNPKVLFSLSDYSCCESVIDKLKCEEILDLCKKNNVNAKHWLTKKGDMWIGRNTIQPQGSMNKDLAFKNLESCHCFKHPVKVIMFFKSNLYICPPAIYFSGLNPDFKISDNETADVFKTPKKRLTEVMLNLTYGTCFELCSRCNAFENRDIRHKPGVQVGENDCKDSCTCEGNDNTNE